MAVDLSAGSHLAQRLQQIVGPKLVEIGWSTGASDDTLTEYVILMLQNGKTQEEIQHELAKDLLDLSPDDPVARDFAEWLFQTLRQLQAELEGTAGAEQAPSSDAQDVAMDQDTSPSMQEGQAGQQSIPTGPKAMRNGNSRGGNRMFNQINTAMNRGDSLHRVQGAGAGSGRINSHSGRGNNRGNKAQQIQRNFDGANRRAMNFNQNQNQNQIQQFPNMPEGMAMQPQILQMMEGMMAQIVANQQHGFVNPNFNGPRNQRNGNHKPQQRNRNQHHQKQGDGDTAMDEDSTANQSEEQKDPAQTMCKFNTYCTKPDCVFAHQTPAAPPGVTVDTSSECPFGVACKNFKCVSRHPSPAKKLEHQQTQECKFGPNCQNSYCPFKHTGARPCRNGGDCQVEGCTFFHSPIECKFNPCTNVRCQFKHKEGQKAAGTNVWKAGEEGTHVSERKFVDQAGGEEEVIIPGANAEAPKEAESMAMAT